MTARLHHRFAVRRSSFGNQRVPATLSGLLANSSRVDNATAGVGVLRHSREMTRLCSRKVAQHHLETDTAREAARGLLKLRNLALTRCPSPRADLRAARPRFDQIRSETERATSKREASSRTRAFAVAIVLPSPWRQRCLRR